MGSALRCLALAVLGLALAPAVAAGDITVDRDQETGILTIVGDDAVDQVTIDQTVALHVISRVGGGITNDAGDPPCEAVGDTLRCTRGTTIAVDLGGENDTFSVTNMTRPISVAGGAGNDMLTTGSNRDVLAGGDGNDVLTGLGGIDDYFGETGNDTIQARDGLGERISCGAGADLADNDFIDIIAECETGVDGDADGFSTAVDCNDASARIFPGAPEVFGNGVDENCNGRDDVNLDVDGDGFPVPVDCNDGNRNVRPNTPEIRGNAVDENCDRRALPWAQFAAVVSNRWAVARKFTRLRTLIVRNAPKGTKLTLRCRGKGCPFKRTRRRTVPRNLAPVRLHRGFRRARLKPGARLKLTMSAPQTIGRTYTYRVKRLALPSSRIVCRAPGARKGRKC